MRLVGIRHANEVNPDWVIIVCSAGPGRGNRNIVKLKAKRVSQQRFRCGHHIYINNLLVRNEHRKRRHEWEANRKRDGLDLVIYVILVQRCVWNICSYSQILVELLLYRSDNCWLWFLWLNEVRNILIEIWDVKQSICRYFTIWDNV